MVMVGFSKIDESYYFALDCTCNSCGYIFKNEDIAIIRGGCPKPEIYCKNCLGKTPKLIFDNEYQIMARGLNKMPNNCLILNLKRGIELENGRIDVWDMESLKKLGGQIIDHRKFTHDGGGMMELPDRKPLDELDMDMNKEMATDEIDEIDYLFVKKPQKELENNQNKQIEDKQK